MLFSDLVGPLALNATGEFTGIFQDLLPIIFAAHPDFTPVCRKLLGKKKRPE